MKLLRVITGVATYKDAYRKRVREAGGRPKIYSLSEWPTSIPPDFGKSKAGTTHGTSQLKIDQPHGQVGKSEQLSSTRNDMLFGCAKFIVWVGRTVYPECFAPGRVQSHENSVFDSILASLATVWFM